MISTFLVSVRSGAYLIRFEGTETICTKIPSLAEHYAYRAADSIAYTLRSKGFEDAHVCTLDGLPATPQSILNSRTPSEEFTVVFNKSYFFAGRDKTGQPLGSRDRREAKSMSKAVAGEVCGRLKRMGFQDAKVIDFANESDDIESELSVVWGSESEPDPGQIVLEE